MCAKKTGHLMSHYDSETGLIKISWSKIRTAEECRQKAYLTSEGKTSEVKDVRVFFQGNVVDRAMRQWLGMEHPPPYWMAKEVDRIFYELEEEIRKEDKGVLRWRHKDDRQQVREFCVECAMRLEPILNQLVTPFEYQAALRFKTKLMINGLDGKPTPILLNGEMDVLTRRDPPLPEITPDLDPIVVQTFHPEYRPWDLKVTKDAQYWRKTVAQLVFYDIACICLFGVPTVEAGLIQPMVDGVPFIPFRVSDEDRTFMFNRIEDVAHNIMRQDYSPKVGTEGCYYCEARNACVRYAPVPGTNTIALF
jgi:hypothetical protein